MVILNTICGMLLLTYEPFVLSIVGAIIAIVKCSLVPLALLDCLESEGREPRLDRDELLLISSMSSSESAAGG